MAFPFGIFGAHHFYLERPSWGALYFFTFRLAGVGWLVDSVRMSSLVGETNKRLEGEMRMVEEIQAQLGSQMCSVMQTNISIHPSGNNGIVSITYFRFNFVDTFVKKQMRQFLCVPENDRCFWVLHTRYC